MLRHTGSKDVWDDIAVSTSRELVFEKARAAYLGLAIGDALGATNEFMTPGEIKAKYKQHRKIF